MDTTIKNIYESYNEILFKFPPLGDTLISLGENLRYVSICSVNTQYTDTFPNNFKIYFNKLFNEISRVFVTYDVLSYDKFINYIPENTKTVFTSGGDTIHRGFFCPLPNPIGKLGRKCTKKSVENNKYSYKFSFDDSDFLIRAEKYAMHYIGYNNCINQPKSTEVFGKISDEFIFKISNDTTLGLEYNTLLTPKIEKLYICEYDSVTGRLKRYIFCCVSGENINLAHYEEYKYLEDRVITYHIEYFTSILNTRNGKLIGENFSLRTY